MSLLIGLLSCHAHRERDILCLDTWVPVARQLGMRVVFLVGDGRHAPATWLDGDYLHCPCDDAYQFLPRKTALFAQWAMTQPDWECCLKSDNDCYIVPERLAAYPYQDKDYFGCEPGGRWRGYCSGGASYGLSRRATAIVAEQLTDKAGAEDVAVGRLMRKNGIQAVYDPRFVPWGSEERRPRPDNDLVTCHKIQMDLWMKIHREMHPIYASISGEAESSTQPPA